MLLHAAALDWPASPTSSSHVPGLENNPVLAAYGAVRSGAAEAVAGAAAQQPQAAAAAADLPGEPGSAGTAAGAGGGGSDSGSEGVAEILAATDARPSGALDAAAVAAAQGSSGSAAMAAPAQQRMTAAGKEGAGAAAGGASVPAAAAVANPELQEAAERLAAYLARQQRPNRYGYLPIAQEWDIWCVLCTLCCACQAVHTVSAATAPRGRLPRCRRLPLQRGNTRQCRPLCPRRVNPTAPADLRGAGVAHGSAGQLVTQAVTTAMPCTRGCARSAGQALIAKQVLRPGRWRAEQGGWAPIGYIWFPFFLCSIRCPNAGHGAHQAAQRVSSHQRCLVPLLQQPFS